MDGAVNDSITRISCTLKIYSWVNFTKITKGKNYYGPVSLAFETMFE